MNVEGFSKKASPIENTYISENVDKSTKLQTSFRKDTCHIYNHIVASSILQVRGCLEKTGKFHVLTSTINRLTPNDPYMGRTATLASKLCILYI